MNYSKLLALVRLKQARQSNETAQWYTFYRLRHETLTAIELKLFKNAPQQWHNILRKIYEAAGLSSISTSIDSEVCPNALKNVVSTKPNQGHS